MPSFEDLERDIYNYVCVPACACVCKRAAVSHLRKSWFSIALSHYEAGSGVHVAQNTASPVDSRFEALQTQQTLTRLERHQDDNLDRVTQRMEVANCLRRKMDQ